MSTFTWKQNHSLSFDGTVGSIDIPPELYSELYSYLETPGKKYFIVTIGGTKCGAFVVGCKFVLAQPIEGHDEDEVSILGFTSPEDE